MQALAPLHRRAAVDSSVNRVRVRVRVSELRFVRESCVALTSMGFMHIVVTQFDVRIPSTRVELVTDHID